MPEPHTPRVFLSYSHDSAEHKERVHGLCNRLREEGIDAWIDQYETVPAEGWPRWAARQVREADFVLIVCTEVYERRFRDDEKAGQGHGVRWEGYVVTQELYDAGARNRKFLPVVFPPWESSHVPDVLRGTTFFDLWAEQGYQDLYRVLTGQPAIVPPPVGFRRSLPSTMQQTNSSSPPDAAKRPAQDRVLRPRYLETTDLATVKEDGGHFVEEDIIARTQRIQRSLAAAQARENRRFSVEAVQAAREEREAVNTRLAELVSNLSASDPGLLQGRNMDGLYTVGTGDVDVAFWVDWADHTASSIRGGKPTLFMSKGRLIFGWTDDVTREVARFELEPAEDDVTWRWVEIGKSLYYSSVELANDAVRRLMDEHERRRKADLQRQRRS
jgi:hypothetical protein